jgi:hypothetical protein
MEPNEDVLKEILELVLYQPVSATELKDRYRSKLTEDTISRHLKTLFDQGHLERSWCGTQASRALPLSPHRSWSGTGRDLGTSHSCQETPRAALTPPLPRPQWPPLAHRSAPGLLTRRPRRGFFVTTGKATHAREPHRSNLALDQVRNDLRSRSPPHGRKELQSQVNIGGQGHGRLHWRPRVRPCSCSRHRKSSPTQGV